MSSSPTPFRSPDAAVPSGPYNPSMRVGDLLFVSGQAPLGRDGTLVGDDFETQVEAVFDAIDGIAGAAGASLAHTVRLGCFLHDYVDFPAWNAACSRRLSEPYPARTTVPCPLGEAVPGMRLEVDAVIWIPGTGGTA